jgi:geranylgeranyl reductase family protein
VAPVDPQAASALLDDPDPPIPDRSQVLVVGAGPAGSACAFWLAQAGWQVTVVERKRFPRAKTCGDGLTPRSVRQLADMGLEGALAGAHRYRGLRACAYGLELELPWPSHPTFPSEGYVVTRYDLDRLVAERARQAGATVLQGTEALEPVLADGQQPAEAGARTLPRCRALRVRRAATGETATIGFDYLVLAEGANARVARALGAQRERRWPLGLALRGYYRSPAHDEPFIESHLDIRDASGAVVPGYGWIFPLGDGRVNVGVGLLSAEGRWRGVNTTRLLDAFLAQAPARWQLSPDAALGQATGGKLPMGLSIAPRVGPNVLLAGDAMGAINPFNGEGIAYGYETGRLAAAVVAEALAGAGEAALASYEDRLQAAYGHYYRVARDFVRLISHPRAMQVCVRTGMHSRPLMAALLRVMANLLRPDRLGAGEATYAVAAAFAAVGPGS